MSLSPAEIAQSTTIIDGILKGSDLETVSAKAIRKSLSEVVSYDMKEKKAAVTALIIERFDHRRAILGASDTPRTNGHASPSSNKSKPVKQESTPPSSHDASTPQTTKTEPDSDDEDAAPPKKKRKQEVTDDAKLAAMLQAQENRSTRATRGAGTKKVAKKPKKPRKKSEKKVKAEDDSEIEEVGSDGEVREKVKKGGFHKQYHLSAPLADVVGEGTLSRPQVVKKIWEYIKARDLQDPSDKRQILCDEKLQLVFKQDKVHMFTMNKILGKQLYDIEE